MSTKKHNDYGTKIPRHEIEVLAQTLYPDILAFFEREDVKQEFEEWLKYENNNKGEEENDKKAEKLLYFRKILRCYK